LIKIQLNGQNREISDNTNIFMLLKQLNLNSKAVAVEVNMNIVSKDDYNRYNIKHGDLIEILTFVAGG